jgi:hypothetical protein
MKVHYNILYSLDHRVLQILEQIYELLWVLWFHAWFFSRKIFLKYQVWIKFFIYHFVFSWVSLSVLIIIEIWVWIFHTGRWLIQMILSWIKRRSALYFLILAWNCVPFGLGIFRIQTDWYNNIIFIWLFDLDCSILW